MIDLTLQRCGQRVIEIAFVHLAAAEISASRPSRDRIDVDRMHLDVGQRRERAAPTAPEPQQRSTMTVRTGLTG